MNAMAFSDPAQPVMVRQALAGGYIRITVSDSGPGIAPVECAHVFQPFYQINRKKTEQQGIGIGLTLARDIVEAHDGVLELDSAVGQGTDVTIVLPVYPMGND